MGLHLEIRTCATQERLLGARCYEIRLSVLPQELRAMLVWPFAPGVLTSKAENATAQVFQGNAWPASSHTIARSGSRPHCMQVDRLLHPVEVQLQHRPSVGP